MDRHSVSRCLRLHLEALASEAEERRDLDRDLAPLVDRRRRSGEHQHVGQRRLPQPATRRLEPTQSQRVYEGTGRVW